MSAATDRLALILETAPRRLVDLSGTGIPACVAQAFLPVFLPLRQADGRRKRSSAT